MSTAPNLTSLSGVRRILRERDLKPLKTLGQNFLVDLNILNMIVRAADLQPGDAVLEIGAGLGVLTEALAAGGRRVVAVEKDLRLREHLESRFAGAASVELVMADALEMDLDAMLASGLNKVVANLPYSAGSAILVNLLRAPNRPRRMVLTLQQEVARRLTAAPGSREFGLLGVWARLDYAVAIRKLVSPGCFYPAPKVKSAIVEFERLGAAPCTEAERGFFYELTKAVFAHRRKQLKAILAGMAEKRQFAAPTSVLEALEISPAARPETLDTAAWLRLARELSAALTVA